jgi:hypothetical protein
MATSIRFLGTMALDQRQGRSRMTPARLLDLKDPDEGPIIGPPSRFAPVQTSPKINGINESGTILVLSRRIQKLFCWKRLCTAVGISALETSDLGVGDTVDTHFIDINRHLPRSRRIG